LPIEVVTLKDANIFPEPLLSLIFGLMLTPGNALILQTDLELELETSNRHRIL
jgi:hypothetical protein